MQLLKPFLAAVIAMALFIAGCQPGDEQTNEQENTSMEETNTEGEVSNENDFGEVDESVQLTLQTMLQPYYRLKDALVAADPEAAQRYAGQIDGIIFNFDAASLPEVQRAAYEEHIDAVSQASQQIQATTSLEEQRQNFEPLSDNLYQLLKKFKATDGNVYRQYCPMAFDNKGAYWLSNEEKIRNPYFGDQMLKCGSVKETF